MKKQVYLIIAVIIAALYIITPRICGEREVGK